jgi:hypothetical protein
MWFDPWEFSSGVAEVLLMYAFFIGVVEVLLMYAFFVLGNRLYSTACGCC